VLTNDGMRDHALRMHRVVDEPDAYSRAAETLAPFFARWKARHSIAWRSMGDMGQQSRGRGAAPLAHAMCGLRLQARHVIHFDFSHGASPDRDVPALTLREPPAYSVEIQRSPTAWHFPSAPDGAEWLCAPLRRPAAARDAAEAQPGSPHGKRKLLEVPGRSRGPASD
jgi:hypothetical protein